MDWARVFTREFFRLKRRRRRRPSRPHLSDQQIASLMGPGSSFRIPQRAGTPDLVERLRHIPGVEVYEPTGRRREPETLTLTNLATPKALSGIMPFLSADAI